MIIGTNGTFVEIVDYQKFIYTVTPNLYNKPCLEIQLPFARPFECPSPSLTLSAKEKVCDGIYRPIRMILDTQLSP